VSEIKPGEKTKNEDLALLCSNCHRIVHRKKPWLSVEKLSELIRT
jgi:putative restriction endonuclease